MFSPFLLANEWAEDGELFDNVSVEEVNSNNALERFNQASAKFNDTVDAYLLKPVAEGYQYITPQVVNSGVSNIFSNIAELPSMFNALLQGKPYVAADNFFRFFINSTVGLLGFFDVATAAGITEQKEDFGQTLARWGAAEGPYVVLPFFGPSTVRNMHGLMIDSVINPINQIEDVPRYVAVAGLKTVDGRADLLSSEKLITSDRYLFIKNAYLQHRHYLESDGNVVDTFDAVELDDDWLE
jgi:phospholipid-binding lipoprotein MlaA